MGGYGKAWGKGKAAARPAPYGGGAAPQAPREQRDDSCKVFVGNLSFKTRWSGLKDHFSQAGEVQFAKINEDKGKGKGWSKGTGMVEFATAEEAQAAIAMLNGSELDGRELKLDAWTTGWTPSA
mmetsp:Transcript_81984/g.248613  ORF Transcript_81984/g.248613 Transcript_81984/m.248613 type:complete len:124 (-) Transcript_81984:128-499(-)